MWADKNTFKLALLSLEFKYEDYIRRSAVGTNSNIGGGGVFLQIGCIHYKIQQKSLVESVYVITSGTLASYSSCVKYLLPQYARRVVSKCIVASRLDSIHPISLASQG